MTFSSRHSQENGEAPEAFVTITDEKGQSLKCVVQSTLEVDRQEYLLLVCADQPVVILTWPDGATRLIARADFLALRRTDSKADFD